MERNYNTSLSAVNSRDPHIGQRSLHLADLKMGKGCSHLKRKGGFWHLLFLAIY
jgi:hypothetical protein